MASESATRKASQAMPGLGAIGRRGAADPGRAPLGPALSDVCRQEPGDGTCDGWRLSRPCLPCDIPLPRVYASLDSLVHT